MELQKLSVETKQRLCHFFIPSLDVTPFHLLMEWVKRKLGKLGKFYFFNKGISRINKLTGSFEFCNGLSRKICCHPLQYDK